MKHDDTAQFQATLNASNNITVPPGRYIITAPLNVTNRTQGITLAGSGEYGNGSIIDFYTGGVGFDFTGSQFVVVKDFLLEGGSSTTIGMLFARSSTSQYSNYDTVENVTITLPSVPSANGGHGTVGIYNCGAELWRSTNTQITADIPMVLTANNVFRITSPFVSFGSISSLANVTVDPPSALNALTGPSVWLDTTTSAKFRNTYMSRVTGNTSLYAIRARSAPWQYQYSFEVSGHIEQWPGLLETRDMLQDVVVNVNMIHTGRVIWLDASADSAANYPGILSGTIRVPSLGGSTNQELIGDGASGSTYGVQNSHLDLSEHQSINIAGRFPGNVVASLLASPSVTVGSPYSYQLLHGNGQMEILTSANTSINGTVIPANTTLVGAGQAVGTGTVTSVGFTGGLISVATGTSTPSFAVAGTSGGIPYFASGSTWASSAALAQYGIVYGGGAGAAPATLAGNTAATDQVVVSHGTGSATAAPTLTNAPALSMANMTGLTARQLPATTIATPGSSFTVSVPHGYGICTATCTVTVAAPTAAGDDFCVWNDVGVSTAITISGVSGVYFSNTALSAYGTLAGSFTATAAAGNKVCMVARDTTHWHVLGYVGTWTAN